MMVTTEDSYFVLDWSLNSPMACWTLKICGFKFMSAFSHR